MICLPPNFQCKKWTSARVRGDHDDLFTFIKHLVEIK